MAEKTPNGGVDAEATEALEASSPAAEAPSVVAVPADACTPPAPLTKAGCRCYGGTRLKAIADGLTELAACRVAVAEKDRLIQARLLEVPTIADAPRIAWWQEPTVIVGGTVVTVGVTAALTAWLISK